MGYCEKHKQQHQTPFCPICLGECMTDRPHTGFPDQLEKGFERLRKLNEEENLFDDIGDEKN